MSPYCIDNIGKICNNLISKQLQKARHSLKKCQIQRTMVIIMNKKYIVFSCLLLALTVVSLILGNEAEAGGFLTSLILLFEIKNAFKETKSRNSLKAFYRKRDHLNKYRNHCIILFIFILSASIFSSVFKLLA